jgi:hypothetical protein
MTNFETLDKNSSTSATCSQNRDTCYLKFWHGSMKLKVQDTEMTGLNKGKLLLVSSKMDVLNVIYDPRFVTSVDCKAIY